LSENCDGDFVQQSHEFGGNQLVFLNRNTRLAILHKKFLNFGLLFQKCESCKGYYNFLRIYYNFLPKLSHHLAISVSTFALFVKYFSWR